jgi:hypothetical protein
MSDFFSLNVGFFAVAIVRKRNIPTERPSLVGEINANLFG